MKNRILGLIVGGIIIVTSFVACKHSSNQSQEQKHSINDSLSVSQRDSLNSIEIDKRNAQNVKVDDNALRLRQNVRPITCIVVHCSATGDDYDTPVDTVTKAHKYRGFKTIGYHYYITRDGVIHRGRDLSVGGAHVGGHNKTTIGICYEGGLRLSKNVDGMHSVTVPENLKDSVYCLFSSIVGKDTIIGTAIHGKPYVPCDTRTLAQKKALSELIKHLKAIYPKATVCGHRDFSIDRNHDGIISPKERLKECPCFDAIPEYN